MRRWGIGLRLRGRGVVCRDSEDVVMDWIFNGFA
jgi:hypothetical protein